MNPAIGTTLGYHTGKLRGLRLARRFGVRQPGAALDSFGCFMKHRLFQKNPERCQAIALQRCLW